MSKIDSRFKFAAISIAAILLCSCGGEDNKTKINAAPIQSQAAGASPAPIITGNQLSFNGIRSNYQISKTSAGWEIRDLYGNDGTSTASANINKLVFKDISINLDIASLAQGISELELTNLIDLYLAYFNRIPDADGLAFWIQRYKSGVKLDAIAEAFFVSAQNDSSLTGYSATANNTEFVTAVYKNVLARTPPDADGLKFWTQQLDRGQVSRAGLIQFFLTAARAYKGDPNYGYVAEILNNKVKVARTYAINQGIGYNSNLEAITKGNWLAASVTASDTAIADDALKALLGYAPLGNSLPSQAQAARFLQQASFGASPNSLSELSSIGYEAWLSQQFQKPLRRHKDYMDQRATTLANGIKDLNQNHFFESFWQQAISADDQLRQRVAFALSEIFVVSFQDSNVANYPRGVASYYDVLAQNAFGNYRELLEQVSLHPMMGIYLTSLRNQKENGNQVPDENYAREVMQLFTIGLYQLNQDGSPQSNGGKAIETYGSSDISGLAKVFTGWSWAGPDKTDTRFYGGNADPNRDVLPMQSYPKFHSVSAKNFLGTTIAAQTSAAPEASLKVALDTLFNHPNVGPFIGRHLIQRLVTSNPSPAYISRVAAAFNNNGKGQRGDMKALLRAILLDPEPRSDTALSNATSGKLREPVLRLANWARAFNASSGSGRFMLTSLDDPLSSLGQTPMRSPSVFNFYRPGYVPPNTSLANAGLVAPEMQITGETSVVGYLNFMRDIIPNGTGSNRDIKADYSNLLANAATPEIMLEQINLLLYANQMPLKLKQQILDSVKSVAIPATPASAVDTAKKNRVYLAIFLSMAAPDYLVEK